MNLPASIDWTTWQPAMRATLIFVFRDGEVLLIRKKRGLGAGKINGPGGKIDPGETPLACALREAGEELGIRPLTVSELGLLHFQFTDGLSLLCHVFRADDMEGTPVETDEAIPLWTALGDIPYGEMWADDELWFPMLIERQPFTGYFVFDGDAMLSAEVRPGMTKPEIRRERD